MNNFIIYSDEVFEKSCNNPILSRNGFYQKISRHNSRNNTVSSINPVPKNDRNPQCEYCKTRDYNWLVKCIDENCNRWFCNSEKVIGAYGSHIYLHLNKLNHKVIELHKDRSYKIGKITCRKCNSDKVFSLGVLLTDGTLLCRVCFVATRKNAHEWASLITEKKIDNDLIKNYNQDPNNQILSLKYIEKIESKYGFILDQELDECDEKYRIYDIYPDIPTYQYITKSLLDMNFEEENIRIERNVIKNIEFEMSDSRKSGFFFGVDYGCKFIEGDEICISSNKNGEWKGIGSVTEISQGKYHIKFEPKAPNFIDKVNMEANINSSTLDRLEAGICSFSSETQDQDILKIVLGHKTKARMSYYHKISDYSMPGKKLNPSQNKAVKNAMKYKCSIIHGPPGTGKSQTIVAILYQILNLIRQSEEYTEKMHKEIIKNEENFDNTEVKVVEVNKKELIIRHAFIKYIINSTDQIENVERILKDLYEKFGHPVDCLEQKTIEEYTQISSYYQKTQDSELEINQINSLKILNYDYINFPVLGNDKAKIDNKNDLYITKGTITSVESKKSVRIQSTKLKPQENKLRLEEMSKCYISGNRILVTAASNTAINVLKQRLLKENLSVLQIYARCREEEYPDDQHSLHYMRNEKLKYNETYEMLLETRKKLDRDLKVIKSKSTKEELEKKLKKTNGKIEKIINDIEEPFLYDFQVICCTCLTAHLKKLKKIDFEHVIIDEATQVLEAESLLCLIKGSTHLVLVGDINQLGSVVQSKKASALGLDVPLIERLTDLGVPQTFLSIQYRMHPKIAEFSNTNFYNNKINNGVTEQDRKHKRQVFPDIVKYESTFFYNIESSEECLGNGDSYLNRQEAEGIKNILSYMYDRKLKGKKIAIITFYDGQKRLLSYYLETHLPKPFIKGVEIMSVDGSQGKEKEYIILSCVRSNTKVGVGFLEEYRRLNVAMTRAKYGLIVCGNLETLLKSRLWSSLISFYAKKNLIFTGSFESLQRTPIKLEKDSVLKITREKKYRQRNT